MDASIYVDVLCVYHTHFKRVTKHAPKAQFKVTGGRGSSQSNVSPGRAILQGLPLGGANGQPIPACRGMGMPGSRMRNLQVGETVGGPPWPPSICSVKRAKGGSKYPSLNPSLGTAPGNSQSPILYLSPDNYLLFLRTSSHCPRPLQPDPDGPQPSLAAM